MLPQPPSPPPKRTCMQLNEVLVYFVRRRHCFKTMSSFCTLLYVAGTLAESDMFIYI